MDNKRFSIRTKTRSLQPYLQMTRLAQWEKYHDAVSKLGNSVCIDNLLKKQKTPDHCPTESSVFINFRLSVQSDNYYLKKQISPHKVKSMNSLLEKIKKHSAESHAATSQKSRRVSNYQIIPRFNQKNKPCQGFIYGSNNNGGISTKKVLRLAPSEAERLRIEPRKVELNTSFIRRETQIHQQKEQRGLQRQASNVKEAYLSCGQINISPDKNNQFQNLNRRRFRYLNWKKQSNRLTSQFGGESKCNKNNTQHSKAHVSTKRLKRESTGSFKANKMRKTKGGQSSFSSFIINAEKDLFEFTEQTVTFFAKETIEVQNSKQFNVNLSTVTSKSVSAFLVQQNGENVKISSVCSKEQLGKTEIASITKVMTCLLALKIAQRFQLNVKEQRAFTTEKASKMQGTSAQLIYSDSGSVWDFLHGLMLPSGNDAAIAIAEWGGKTIRKYYNLIEKHKREIKSTNQKVHNSYSANPNKKSNVRLFIHHMNKASEMLSLSNTYFANAHGLMNSKSYSTAFDVCCLAYYAMQNSHFREIVSSQSHQCKLYNRTYSRSRLVSWKNTNKLVAIPDCIGVKTGITPAAGPCLVSQFQISKEQSIIICVLKSTTTLMRFRDTLSVLKSILESKLRISNDQKLNKRYKKMLGRLQKISDVDLTFEGEDQNVNNMEEDQNQNDSESTKTLAINELED